MQNSRAAAELELPSARVLDGFPGIPADGQPIRGTRRGCARRTYFGAEAGPEIASSSLRACRAVSVFGYSFTMASRYSFAFTGYPVSLKR